MKSKSPKKFKTTFFSINFEMGSTEKCPYTGDRIEITEDYLKGFEERILGRGAEAKRRQEFRKVTQKAYATKTLPQEIMGADKTMPETELFKDLTERYIYNIKEKVLDPFLDNENFRRAIKDYDGDDFKTYDRKIRDDVAFLMNNLINKHRYTAQGAKAVCIYVIDNELARKFKQP
jgi:hypothetical protein